MDRKEKWRKISVNHQDKFSIKNCRKSINSEEVVEVGNKFGEDNNGSKGKVEKDKTKISRQMFHQELYDHTSPEEVVEIVNKFGEDNNGSKGKVEKDKRKISRQIFHQGL
ncbi:unnamed protein product [Rhizophagus irregularis]|nr:unnamed protein product [Rhizophagus irregularis]CAB4446408.1 unnamed protein product [Rhizophagus irregularis]